MGGSVLTCFAEVVYSVVETVEGLEDEEAMIVVAVEGDDMSAVVLVSVEVETGGVDVMIVNGSSVVVSPEESCTTS